MINTYSRQKEGPLLMYHGGFSKTWKPCYLSLQRAYLHVYESKEVRRCIYCKLDCKGLYVVCVYVAARVLSLRRVLCVVLSKEPALVELATLANLKWSLLTGQICY